ncbi:MAG: hypothetical protein PGN13_16210 [Patulibacter minatonensis]
MGLCQITTRTLRADRIDRGERPVFEIHLEDHQDVIAITIASIDQPHRETIDHVANVTVLTRLGEGL